MTFIKGVSVYKKLFLDSLNRITFSFVFLFHESQQKQNAVHNLKHLLFSLFLQCTFKILVADEKVTVEQSQTSGNIPS